MRFKTCSSIFWIIVFSFCFGCSQENTPEFGPQNGTLVIVGGGIGDEVSIYEKTFKVFKTLKV